MKQLPVVYEDADLTVVDKPAGLLTHPAPGQSGPTVADLTGGRTVHRLDKDTSGLLMVAKTEPAKEQLQRQFADRRVQKAYLVLVTGRLKLPEAVIKLPIGRRLTNPTKWAVRPGGRPAITRYEVLAEYPGYSLLKAYPETGRTHQLRVHFSHLGHPVAGDATYGPSKRPSGLGRQFLHASELSFTSPSGQAVRLSSPLPPDLQGFLDKLGKV